MGWMILNALQACFFAAWTMLWISLALVVRAATGRRERSLAMARRYWAPGLLWAGGIRLEIDGLEHVDFSKPHVFVANHESMIDIAVVFAALPVNLHFVLKKELSRMPFIGWYAHAMGMIFVDRRARAEAISSLAKVGELIRGGRSVIAFPEGTRSRGRGVLPFKKGVFIAALEAGVPVVPVALAGAEQVLPSDTFRARPGVVRVHVGRPIQTSNLTIEHRNELPTRARNQIERLLGAAAIVQPESVSHR